VIRYLLDTDICSYISRRRYPSVLSRFAQIRSEDWAISAITYAEIQYGLESSREIHSMQTRVNAFLFMANVLDWPAKAAHAYAGIKNRTRQQPLAEQDMLIAAHAIAIDAIIVTNNVRHFNRMGGGLRFENWLD